MAKHRRVWNAGIYEKHIREGRGHGFGPGYLPWIYVQDFASRGIASRVKGRTTGRVHHLMSNNELAYFYILDWSDNVTDIREQYPLSDLELAVKIAAQAGIKYPTDRVSGYPYVLTCDFMVTTVAGLKARTVKASSELNNARTLEKLEIERRYWEIKGIEWKIITEREIPYQKARNIEWLYASQRVDSAANEPYELSQAQDMMLAILQNGECSVLETAQIIENEFRLASGSGLQIFKQLILEKAMAINLDEPLKLNTKGVVVWQ